MSWGPGQDLAVPVLVLTYLPWPGLLGCRERGWSTACRCWMLRYWTSLGAGLDESPGGWVCSQRVQCRDSAAPLPKG